MKSLTFLFSRHLKMHTISCKSHFVVMDTDRKKRLKKKKNPEKENIICVHGNWVKFSAAKNGLGKKNLLRDVRYVHQTAPCMLQRATSKQSKHVLCFKMTRLKSTYSTANRKIRLKLLMVIILQSVLLINNMEWIRAYCKISC